MDKTLLKKATADTPEPTPGYMYRDIIAMTFVDMKTQDKVLQFLIDKIKDSSSSTHVLSKTLRIIKQLCEKGHADFQKEMQRQADTIKQCAQYRGKPDPTYGDMLNEQVRAAGREAMEACFNSRRDAKTLEITSQGGKADDDKDKPKQPTFTTGQVVGKPATGGTALESATAQVAEAVKSGFGLWKEKPKSANEKMLEDMYNQQHQQGQYITPTIPVEVATVPIPGFGGPAGGEQANWKTLTQNAATTSQPVKVLSPAQRHVEKLVSMKTSPQRLELSNFLQGAQQIVEEGSTTWDDIAAALDENLVGSCNWQVRLNALLGLEALAKSSITDVIQYFTENPDEIQKNVNVVQSTLKERAVKVLTLLGLPTQAPEQKKSVPAAMFANPTGKAEMTWAPSLANAPEDNGAGSGMFADAAGMKVRDRQKDKTGKLKKRAPATGGVFSTTEEPAPTYSAPMNTPPVPVSAKPTYDVLDDLFGGPAVAVQPVQAPPTTAKAFSFM
jgi:hypothetical protein